MFKKFTTSLSKPPLTIFFMKDSWFKVILYVLLVTFLVVIPGFIRIALNPTMDINRYQEMQSVIKKDFIIENAQIIDGTLTYETADVAEFGFFAIYLGSQSLGNNSVNFVFEDQSLALYVMDVELDRVDYEAINLENHDFSSTENEDITRLSVALKTMYERQTSIMVAEVFAVYLFTIFDYLIVALLMAFLMAMFMSRIPMPFFLRLKLSLYVTTVYAVFQLILVLFNATYLNALGMLIVYFYHSWTYRSIKIIPKGVI
jgi:hypothetical protein